MSDSTRLNPMNGGVYLVTETLDEERTANRAPLTRVMPVSKLRTGIDGQDGGDVAESNPLHVRDALASDQRTSIQDQLDTVIELLRQIAAR